jgi:hypothetical protein
MSYIRCLSNPERLYVIHHIDGYIEIMYNFRESCQSIRCNLDDWEAMIKYFDKQDIGWASSFEPNEEPLRFGSISIREVRVLSHTNILYEDNPIIEDSIEGMIARTELEYKIELTVGDKKIYLWAVTWAYLIRNAVHSRRLDKWYRRLYRSIRWRLNPKYWF